MDRFNIRDYALSKRASHVLRVRLGICGQGSLILPHNIFSEAIQNAFTMEEMNMMLRKDLGLTVPTMDENGRVFQVVIFNTGGAYALRGSYGWRRLTFFNNFNENTIISIWIYRERLALGSILEIPRFLVMHEGLDKFFCSECKRHCVHWE